MSFSHQIKFAELSKLLENVSISTVAKKREEYFRDFFKKMIKFRDEFRMKNPNENSSLLPIIRLILSQEEKERSYGIQEKSLRQLYTKVIGLGKNNPDYDKILKCSEDEISNKVCEVLQSRLSNTGTLLVDEVDNLLHFFSDNQKSSLQEKELSKLYLNASALDHKWICRMILKRMRMNMGTASILRTLHTNAPQLFLKHNHLSKVVEVIDDGTIDHIKVVDTVEPFTTIKSMLCEKISNSNKAILSNSKIVLYQETKMDGERFHLHFKDSTFQYLSRNGHNYSEGFNDLLTPLIKFSTVVHSLILDGEMMVYDNNERTYYTKGETSVDVKLMKPGKRSNFRPCYCAFDILYYNGVNLMTRPYHERMDILSQLFQDREGVLVKTKPIRIRDVDHLIELFNLSIEKMEEGIVVKESNSPYRAGERGGGWYKIKSDYFDGDLVKDFDCVIIGGFYENSNSKNFIKKYMVGAIEKLENGKWNVHAIGEVFSGLSKQERMDLDSVLKSKLVAHSGESVVNFGDGNKILFGLNKPDVWIPPDESVVLECRASELARTSEQKTSYTFRFPRITKIRKDKSWDETCTLKEFEELYQDQEKLGKVKKLTMRNATTSDMISPSRKRKTVESRNDVLRKFQNELGAIREGEILDNVLESKEFCVKSSDDGLPAVGEIQNIIRSHGGNIVQHPREGKTFAIVCGRVPNDIKKYIRNKCMNVIKSSWVVRELKNEALPTIPKLRPKFDLIFATDELMKEVGIFFDEFGDSYNEEIKNVEELKEILSYNETADAEIDDGQIADMEIELEDVCGLRNINIFRKLSGHFISSSINHSLNCSQKLFEFFKGNVMKERGDSSSMVFCDKNENLESISMSAISSTMIDHAWICDSIDAGKLLNREKYLIQ